MANKPHFDIEVATQLRKIGWNYADIALYMQCSEEWCKRNLRGVEKDYDLMQRIADWQLKQNKDPVVLSALLDELG